MVTLGIFHNDRANVFHIKMVKDYQIKGHIFLLFVRISNFIRIGIDCSLTYSYWKIHGDVDYTITSSANATVTFQLW